MMSHMRHGMVHELESATLVAQSFWCWEASRCKLAVKLLPAPRIQASGLPTD